MKRMLFVLILTCASSASATTRFVYPDGSGTYPNVQAAINASIHGDSVLLADGVFTGTGNYNLDCLGKDLVIRSVSGDPSRCVIDCAGLGRGLWLHSGEGPACVIEGLTVTHGRANTGAGMKVQGGAAPTIRHCRFVDNDADSDGGAVSCWLSSAPVFIDCEFVRSHAHNGFGGGLEIQSYSTVRLEGCVVQGCTALYGAGVEVWEYAHATASYCTFVENQAGGAGGAVECFGNGNLTLENCTIVANSAEGSGSGLANPGGSPSVLSVTNTIVAFGTYPAVYCSQLSVIDLSCTDIFGNGGTDWVDCIADQYGVRGNIGVDPLFCGSQNPLEPYTLDGSSLCAPGNNPECGLIGAWPVGCPTAGAPSSPIDRGRGAADVVMSVRPNPIHDGARILFDARDAIGPARVSVCDATGRVVRRLYTGSLNGVQDVMWDGRDEAGHRVSSGVYFCRMESGAGVTTRMVVVAR